MKSSGAERRGQARAYPPKDTVQFEWEKVGDDGQRKFVLRDLACKRPGFFDKYVGKTVDVEVRSYVIDNRLILTLANEHLDQLSVVEPVKRSG